MKYLSLLFIWLAQPAPLVVHWEGPALHIHRDVAGCLYLVGAGRPETALTDWGCDESTALLPSEGGDENYSPHGRTVELRDTNGGVIASTPVPLQPDRWKQRLPLIAAWLPVPRREWTIILPIVVK